jgi:geranylgeranyl diphosphate synthase, type II
MESGRRIEMALDRAVAHAEAPGAPPLLAEALRYAVFPGGHRIRPRLCLSVARACGDDDPAGSEAAAAIELLHCASLVHDDLPCFDDAAMRRQKPSVHVAFGQPIAVLAGDALIVLAFETVARAAGLHPGRLVRLVGLLGRAAGSPSGIAAGQAWESEAHVSLSDYQQAKTGALFAAATVAGAAAAGAEPEPWRRLGECLGEAYQVADDLRDVACRQEEIGKPAGRDATLGRPNAAALLGTGGALDRLARLTREAVAAIPACPGAAALTAEIEAQARLFLPASLRAVTA